MTTKKFTVDTSRLPVIPAGHVFVATFGNDYRHSVDGVFRAVRDIDLPALVNQWIFCNPYRGEYFSWFRSDKFIRWIVYQGYLEQIPAFNWYLGDHDAFMRDGRKTVFDEDGAVTDSLAAYFDMRARLMDKARLLTNQGDDDWYPHMYEQDCEELRLQAARRGRSDH